MGKIRSRTSGANDPAVAAAQRKVDGVNETLKELGIETAKLAASSSPIGGQLVDGASAIANISAGNYGAAFLDGLGMVPVAGDFLKGSIRGVKIGRAAMKAKKALDVAKAALTRAKAFAKTRAAAKAYWKGIKGKRDAIIKKYKGCKTAACAKKRDAELRGVTRLPKTGGKWVDKNGNPVPAGSGYWKPDPGTPLAETLKRYKDPATGKPVTGVPFKDGAPDFTGFPPKGMSKTHQVEIDMSGDSRADISAAQKALRDKGGPDTRGSGQNGTWHHEPDGVTMSYVDKDVHTAYKKADGSANPGTPHAGGDSMTRDPEF
jgi:hypothetical protein